MMDYPVDDKTDLVVETGCAVRYGIEANAALIHQLVLQRGIVLTPAELLTKELELRKCMTDLYVAEGRAKDPEPSTATQARMLFEKYGPYVEGQLMERNQALTDEQLAQFELRVLNLINTMLDDFR